MIYKEISGFFDRIPALTFGGASLSGEGGGYGFGPLSDKEAEALIKEAWEQGVTFFDTAPIYGYGLSEQRLGKFLEKDAVIISKAGVDWHPTKRVNMTNDPQVIKRMLQDSLRRLNREYIDIYMVHWPDAKIDIRKSIEIIAEAQRRGQVKHIGLCNTTSEDIKRAQEVCEIKVIQSELNLFNQKPFEDLGESWKNKVSLGWGTFDKGILSGRVTFNRRHAPEDARSWAPWWNKKTVEAKILRVQRLKNILDKYNIHLPHFCIQYSLRRFGISSCLIGFKSVQDIQQSVLDVATPIHEEIFSKVLDEWTARPADK